LQQLTTARNISVVFYLHGKLIVFCRREQVKENGAALKRELASIGQQLGQISFIELH